MIPRKTLTVKRFSSGDYVLGHWVEGTESQFTIKASVQPVKGPELQSMPEGRRDSQIYKLYTDTKLNGIDKQGKKSPDIVVIDGEDFEVVSPEPWQNQIINHYKIFVIKVQTEK